MKFIENYIDRLENVLENDLSEEEFEQLQVDVSNMENEIERFIPRSDFDERLMAKLDRLIARVKVEFDIYDPDAALNMMFPNRDDNDFDEIGDFMNRDLNW